MKWMFLAAAVATLAGEAPVVAQVSASLPPIAAYGDLPSIEEGTLSPSGNHSALLTTSEGERRILVLDREGQPVKRFDVGDAKVRNIEWLGDQAILVIRSESDQLGFRYANQRVEWLRANVLPMRDDQEVISVFAGQRRIVNAVMGYYGIREVNGRWKGYFASLRKGDTSGERDKLLDQRPVLFEVDLLTGAADQIAPPTFYPWRREWLVDDAGKIAATLDTNYDTGEWRIENARAQTIAQGKDSSGSASLDGLTPSGDALIFSYFDEKEGSLVRRKQPLAGGSSEEVYAERLKSYVRIPGSARILGALTADDRVIAEHADDEARLEKVFAAFDGGSRDIKSLSVGLRDVLVRTSGNYDSGSWYRFDVQSGQKSILGLERPSIQGQVIGKIQEFSYKAGDGLEISAILTLPSDRKAVDLPVIILPHGGPTSHDEFGFDWWAQGFASRGYAVLQPNFRGSTDRGEAFRAAGDGGWGRKMQSDLSDGLAALAEAGVADPDRACIVGASYGGYAALAGVTIQKGLYRCAVAVAPVTDLPLMFRDMITGRRDIFRLQAERLLGADSDLAALSPARNAHRADAPILLIHGREDSVVPYAQSVRMEDALQDAGKSVRLVSLTGEDHWLSRASTRKTMLSEAIEFVEQNNPRGTAGPNAATGKE